MFSQAREVDKLHEGISLQGRVVATLSGGRVVFRSGEILAPAGSGCFIAPGLRNSTVLRFSDTGVVLSGAPQLTRRNCHNHSSVSAGINRQASNVEQRQ